MYDYHIFFDCTESQRLGQSRFTLPVGTGGVEVGEEIIRWYHEYSAWELFALETCQIFHTPGVGTGNSSYEREREKVMKVIASFTHVLVHYFFIDPSPSRQVERVTEIAKLVTEMLKHDWSLAVYLRPITSQYFNIIQT